MERNATSYGEGAEINPLRESAFEKLCIPPAAFLIHRRVEMLSTLFRNAARRSSPAAASRSDRHFPKSFSSSPDEPAATLVEFRVRRVREQVLQNRDSGGGCQRISRERTCLINLPDRRQAIHDLLSPEDRGQRKTAADDLPESHQIGLQIEITAGAGKPDAKTRDDLVEKNESAVRRAPGRRGTPEILFSGPEARSLRELAR